MIEKKISLEDIEPFLSANGFTFDIEEDNKFHAWGSGGYHISSSNEYRLHGYCLRQFLTRQLGMHFEKLEENSILVCHMAGMDETQTNNILWAFKFLRLLVALGLQER